MKIVKFPFAQTGQFANIFVDYIGKSDKLKTFYGLYPTKENFETQARLKQTFPAATRQVLCQSLNKQYENLPQKPQISIDLLQHGNTFTLTTGHQLNIFTGTLYFHYKIMTVINAAKTLRKQFPNYNFVPVYWMASEDHDAAEIASFNLFGKTYTWQHEQKGAVGRFIPHSLQDVVRETPEMDALFVKAYTESATLGEATRYIVNELYGREGLVVIDGDDADLKRLFAPVMRQELLNNDAHRLMNGASAELEKLGYTVQVNPREINLFWVENSLRERIVKTENEYQVLNSALKFSETEILALLEKNPEKFSPNVVMRPLYQETILPNLSYTGGPGEFAYWLQLKTVFEHFNIPFPILLPRNFALVISASLAAKRQKLNLATEDLFLSEHGLKQKFLQQNVEQTADIDLETKALENILQQIAAKAALVDKSLEGFASAEAQKVLKIAESIEKRIKKAIEQKHTTELQQLLNLQEKLFPKGGLQERYDNFLNFYLNNNNFLAEVMQHLDAFVFEFYVLEE